MVVEFLWTAKRGRAKIEHTDTYLSRSVGLDELDVAVEQSRATHLRVWAFILRVNRGGYRGHEDRIRYFLFSDWYRVAGRPRAHLRASALRRICNGLGFGLLTVRPLQGMDRIRFVKPVKDDRCNSTG